MAREPKFLQGMLGSAVPVVVAIAVIVIATALFYSFWFGLHWFAGWLF